MQEMDTKRKDHLPKFVTLETAVQAVRSGDWVDYGFGVGFPELLDHALAARKGEVRDVKVRGGLVARASRSSRATPSRRALPTIAGTSATMSASCKRAGW